MEIIYIALGVMIIALFIKIVIIPNIRFKKVYELLQKYEDKGFILLTPKKRNYEFTLENENILLLIKVIGIPSNSCITINSKNTWKLSWGGSSYRAGRSYPNDRYLHEVVDFINEARKDEKIILKLFILYPHTEKILRYLNESELEIITPNKTPYGYKITTYKSFELDFNEIINIK